MNSHEYLMQIRLLNKKINNKLQELGKIRHLAQGVGAIRYDKDKVQTSSTNDQMVNAMIRITECEQEINDLIDEFVDKKDEIISYIDKLEDADEYDIIYKYYVCEMSWTKVADECGFCYETIMRKKKSALQKISHMMS